MLLMIMDVVMQCRTDVTLQYGPKKRGTLLLSISLPIID